MTSYRIVAAQAPAPIGACAKEVYYSAERHLIPIGANESIIISSQEGGTGNFFVDDHVTIVVEDDAGNKATYKHDFSANCSTSITPIPPLNLNEADAAFNQFRGKTVSINFEIVDLCGGDSGYSDLWATIQ